MAMTSASIHMKLQLEACQVLSRGVRQPVPTQIQGGEVLQVEEFGIHHCEIVVT